MACAKTTETGQHHQEPGQHHEHPQHLSLPKFRNRVSIMSISCKGLCPNSGTRPASLASAAIAFAPIPEPRQHHKHQLHWSSPKPRNRDSIMSISCNGPCENLLNWASIASISCNGPSQTLEPGISAVLRMATMQEQPPRKLAVLCRGFFSSCSLFR